MFIKWFCYFVNAVSQNVWNVQYKRCYCKSRFTECSFHLDCYWIDWYIFGNFFFLANIFNIFAGFGRSGWFPAKLCSTSSCAGIMLCLYYIAVPYPSIPSRVETSIFLPPPSSFPLLFNPLVLSLPTAIVPGDSFFDSFPPVFFNNIVFNTKTLSEQQRLAFPFYLLTGTFIHLSLTPCVSVGLIKVIRQFLCSTKSWHLYFGHSSSHCFFCSSLPMLNRIYCRAAILVGAAAACSVTELILNVVAFFNRACALRHLAR